MAVKSVSGMLKVCVIIEKCFFFSCRNVVSSYADIQVIIIIFPLLHISTHTHSTVEWLVCSRVSPHVGNICKYIWCNGRWFFAVYFCHITHINFVSVFLSSSVRLSVCLSVCDFDLYLIFDLTLFGFCFGYFCLGLCLTVGFLTLACLLTTRQFFSLWIVAW